MSYALAPVHGDGVVYGGSLGDGVVYEVSLGAGVVYEHSLGDGAAYGARSATL